MHDLSNTEIMALKAIRNSLVHQGRTPSVRELMNALGYKSPRSAALIIESLMGKNVLRKKEDGTLIFVDRFSSNESRTQTVNVPLVGTVACGQPVLAEEDVEAMIPVSLDLVRPPHKYFLLRAAGDSMDQAGIEDGNFLLVRQQATAETGNIVVACIDGETTVKEFHSHDDVFILKPRSKNLNHQPIILGRNFLIQGVVIKVIPGL